MEDIDETFKNWLNGQQGAQCAETSILHMDSYKEVLEARLKAAFVAGAISYINPKLTLG